jgi:hypothetical protein
VRGITQKIAISLGHSRPHPAEYLQRARKGPAASPLWRRSIRVLQKSGRRIIIIFLGARERAHTEQRVKRKFVRGVPESTTTSREQHSFVLKASFLGRRFLLKSCKRGKVPGAAQPPTNLAPRLRARKSNFICSAKCISRKIGNNTLHRSEHAKFVQARERKSLWEKKLFPLDAAYHLC